MSPGGGVIPHLKGQEGKEQTIDIDSKEFTRIIRRSAEDGLFVGSLPEIAPECCHGASVAEVAALLDEIAEDSLYVCLQNNIPFDAPGSAKIIVPQCQRNKDTARMIADLRRDLNLSQSDFAAALGVSKSTLSKWETGERRPDAATGKLLRILRKQPEYITA